MGGEGNNAALLPSGQVCREFSLAEILSATHNFHEDLVIGKGGFGKVYKGFIDEGVTTIVAIKRLDVKSCSGQGADEFWTEVKMLTSLRHCNLVSLIGFCSDKEMILVYEYMRNGTLHDHLHKVGASLSWIQRLKICVDAARGLDYLHTGASSRHRIIHRDVKSANILLDDSLAARIADFGLSKVGPADQAHSYVSTNLKGSFGYFDPDYFYTGQLTRKSDVYSFGVVLFEVLCGKRAVHPNSDGEPRSLVKWVQECVAEGKLDEVIDSRVRGEIVPECLKQFAEIANKCLESSSKKRPTMAEVVFKLELALSFQQEANSPADENVDSAVVNMDSHKLDGNEVYGTGGGCQDEWIMGDGSSKSYVKPVSKVKVFDSVSNKLIVKPAADQEVIDDVGCGLYEDEWIMGDGSSKSYVKPVSKVKVFDSVSNKLIVEPAAGKEDIDDVGCGLYEDEWITGDGSSKSYVKPVSKVKVFDSVSNKLIVEPAAGKEDIDDVGCGLYEDEWITGDGSSKSYVKPVSKVKVFDSVSNKLIVEPAAGKEDIDDVGCGLYEDEWITGDGSSKSYVKPVSKVKVFDSVSNKLVVEPAAGQEDIDNVGCGLYEDEWSMGDGSSKSYVKPVSKVKVFDSVNNKLIVEPAADKEVIDDVGCGLYEDESIFNETSSGEYSGRKITFSMKMKKFFTPSVRKNSGHNDQTPLLGKLSMDELKCTTKNGETKRFSMDELKCATRNFRSDMKLGSGRFGEVFIGWLDADTYSPSVLDVGLMVAVKKVYQPLKVNKEQWMLEILQEFRDPHFVKLIGYCLENEVLLLVSEFMQNGSIHSYLITSAESLPWATRVKMALGVAQGLVFLYETFCENIDTQNVDVMNIMLDKDFNAKFSDFEVAKIVCGSLSTDNSKDPMYFHIKPQCDRFCDILLEILFQILLQEPAYSREWKEKVHLLRSSEKFSVADPRLKHEGVLDGESQLAKALIKYFPTAPKDIVRILKEVNARLEKRKNRFFF